MYKDYPPVLGGIEKHLRLLAEGQVRLGHDVTVLVTSTDFRTTVAMENGVRVIRASRLATVASTPISLALAAWLRRLRCDVVHLQFPYPFGDLAHQLCGRGQADVITYQSDIVRQRRLERLYRPCLYRALARADRVIVSSRQYLDSSVHLARWADKCRVVPLGIDPDPFQTADRASVARVREELGTPLLLFVGRFRYYKGVEFLVQACSTVDATLAIVGTGPMGRSWRRLSKESEAADRIHFVGEVSDSELPHYYAAADVVVLPSSARSEAFGMVLIEAQAAGRPVVSTELGTGTSFVNQDGETGLVVPPGDPEALARALRELLQDEERRRRMGELGRRRMLEEFHIDKMVERTLGIYREALAETASK